MKEKGFTLIEILVVVVLLGLLAAIVIPAFANSTNDAKDSALAQNLVMLRRFVLIYTAQHLEVPPGYPGGDRSAQPTEEAFLDQMLMASNQKGETAAPGTPDYRYGPYMQRMPRNPFNNLQTVRILGDNEDWPESPDNQHGWYYKPATGEVRAGDNLLDVEGKPHWEY